MVYNILGNLKSIPILPPDCVIELLESDGCFYFRLRTHEEDSLYEEDWFYTHVVKFWAHESGKFFLKGVENLKKSFIRNKKIEYLLG